MKRKDTIKTAEYMAMTMFYFDCPHCKKSVILSEKPEWKKALRKWKKQK